MNVSKVLTVHSISRSIVKKSLALGGITAGLAATLLFAAPAYADGSAYVGDAVSSLQDGSTYVANGSNGSGLNTYDGTNVGVVVVPVNSNDTLNPSQLAGQIYGQVSGKYDTVIVVNSDSSNNVHYGVAPGAASSKVLPILQDNGDVVSGLVSDKQELINAVAQPTNTGGDSGSSIAPFVGVGGGLLGILLVGAVVLTVTRRRTGKSNRPEPVKAIKSDELRKAMETFGKLTVKHTQLGYPTAKLMKSLLGHLNELFTRLERKGNEDNQKGLAEVEYTHSLSKLNAALGADYYLDIAENETLWTKSRERLREVEDAVKAVDDQALENIRQVNSSQDLNLRVSLESILSVASDKIDVNDLLKPQEKKTRWR